MSFTDNFFWAIIQQTGMAASKVLRSHGYKNLIIGVTGNVLDSDVNEYLYAGVDMVLSKPLKSYMLKLLLCHIQTHGPLSHPGENL